MMDFELAYKKVVGIVHKARRDYYLKLWEKEDWDQEGMLILHHLLENHPELVEDERKLCTFFKVKFTNYVKDQVRSQESQKRRFDRMDYEEISELAYEVRSAGLVNDELIVLRTLLADYRESLPVSERTDYDRLLTGERFNGRKKLERKLAAYLAEYRGCYY